jgi:hypothetical protein
MTPFRACALCFNFLVRAAVVDIPVAVVCPARTRCPTHRGGASARLSQAARGV